VLTRLHNLSRRRRALLAVLAAAALVALWGIVDLLRITGDIRGGERVLKTAKATELAKPHGLVRAGDTALRRFRHADRIARRGLPFVLTRPVPLLGHQVAAVRSMTKIAVQVGTIGDDATRALQTQLDDAAGGADGRVALLDTAVRELGKAKTRLRPIRLHHDFWVLPPLRQARNNVGHSLAEARKKVDEASTMAAAMRRMFVGPSRYLILAGNNAEMRSGPMPLSAGVAEINNGKIKMGKFYPADKLFLKKYPIKPPPDLDKLYGWMLIGNEWRATTATPNFPSSGRLYQKMAPEAHLGHVDGVLFVDVRTLRQVIDATGPVQVGDMTYTAENVEDELLNQNYLKFKDQTKQSRAKRANLQGAVGRAAFDALNSRPLKLGKLVANLAAAGKGRHLMAWSADKDMRLVWRRAGLDGALKSNDFMIILQNVSANKLDYYIRPRVVMKTVWNRRGVRRIDVAVTFSNRPRYPTSEVIEGIAYDRKHGMADGEHRVWFLAYLPRTAVNVAAAHPPFSTAGTDGSARVVGFFYGVKVGQTRTVHISFSVPANQEFRIVPSARIAPVPYVTPKKTYLDKEPYTFKM
jgi:hypothetical protein